ncbi:Kinase superfamily protein isoform 1 [Tripterygium wilfordii]|uniref:non-specific serine/threonine protein kinase n=1 Tax=Tripterygium wilfordii TaxID=458696 RepID=A0A7J7CXT1_TRIWF|nr:Kinase superfamily protein isoform 1 [Tripterygium wilfordii]
MSKYATIAGGAAGLLAFVAMVIGVVWFCKSQCKNLSNRNSETGSSDPSALVEWNGGAGPSSAPDQSTLGPPEARQFTMEELEQATKQFSEINLIGFGSFGSVYKVNSSADTGQESSTKLEFKQRLSIALGAAKGLCHLHALSPPLVHKNFKTANVLVDENFIAKVADAGISKILEKIEEAGPSHMSRANAFDDPEVGISGTFTEVSDAYSFGVFLLELITGQRATHIDSLGSEESFIQWVRLQLTSNNFVDYRLHGSFTVNGIRDLIRLTIQCMSFLGRGRPVMEMVVQELERIHEKEMALTTVMGECTTTITLGSELFT